MARLLLVAMLASGCTILGASGGALVGNAGNGDHVGQDALIGAGIGAAVDLTVVVICYWVQSSMTRTGD